MKNKAFTLVELLSVIVILGIIVVITVPIIMNVVANARRDAFVESVYAIVKATNQYRANAMMNHTERTLNIDYAHDENVLDVSGELPTSGNLSMDVSGKIELKLWSDKAGICVVKNKDDSKIEISDLDKSNCHL